VEFLRRHDLIEPEVLRRRLAGLPIADSQVIVPVPPERGRPSKHLDRYMAKFEERVGNGAVLGNPMDEARFLRAWLKESLASEAIPAAESDLPKEETIRNKLIRAFDFSRRHRKIIK
jgi:hypothetical protein